jgi:acyl dehydratase
MLTASIADALIVGSGIIEGYAVAMIGIDGLMAKKGVYAGDTISVEFEVRTPFRQAALPAG